MKESNIARENDYLNGFNHLREFPYVRARYIGNAPQIKRILAELEFLKRFTCLDSEIIKDVSDSRPLNGEFIRRRGVYEDDSGMTIVRGILLYKGVAYSGFEFTSERTVFRKATSFIEDLCEQSEHLIVQDFRKN